VEKLQTGEEGSREGCNGEVKTLGLS